MKWRLRFTTRRMTRSRKASQSRTGLSKPETFPGTLWAGWGEKGQYLQPQVYQPGCWWVQGSDYREEEISPNLRPQLRVGAAQEFYCPGRGEEWRRGEDRGREGGEGMEERGGRRGEGRGGAVWIQACGSRSHLGGCHMVLAGKGRICLPL